MLLPEPPRVGEPESAMVPGMSAPKAEISPLMALSFGGVGGLADTSTASPTPPGELLQSPIVWTYDLNPASGNWRATFNGEVNITQGGAVTSFNGRTGAVTMTAADITGAGGILAGSPALTGTPTAPTPTPASLSNTQIATTAFVQQAIAATPTVNTFNGRMGAITLNASDITSAGGALTASPALTGTPTAPTATLGDASSLIASTQFVANAIGAGAVTAFNGRKGSVTLQLTDITTAGGAPLASPGFTGTPNAPTAAPGTATNQLATTAYVTNAVTGATTGVSSFNTRTGAVTLTTADITGAGGAPNTSPNFAGTPQAPTATAGTATAQIATTQFVSTAIASLPSGVTTFNGRSGTVTLQLTDVTSVGGAPLASPTFTGTPRAPTPTAGDNSQDIATTAFVANAGYAPLASPTFTGTVTIPAGASIAGYLPLAGGTLTGPLNIVQSSTTNSLKISSAAANTVIQLDKTNATGNNQIFSTVNNTLARWAMSFGDSTAESGTSTGSNFVISRFDNSGNFIDSPLNISRANGNLTTIKWIYISPTSGSDAALVLNKIGQSSNYIIGCNNSSYRWQVAVGDGSTETGGNQGSNILYARFSDAGSYLDIPFSCTRSNGVCTFSQPIVNGSDLRQKRDVEPIADALERVRKLIGVSYERDNRPGRRELGLIAQEVLPIVPEAVSECLEPEGEQYGNKIGSADEPLLGVCYTQFTALLIEAVKSLADKVETLEARMETSSP